MLLLLLFLWFNISWGRRCPDRSWSLSSFLRWQSSPFQEVDMMHHVLPERGGSECVY